MSKKKYVLVDAQADKNLELHVAFRGKDNEDQILCELTEKAVAELINQWKKGILHRDFNLDGDVIEYVTSKYSGH